MDNGTLETWLGRYHLHVPVMAREVVDLLQPKVGQVFVDATLGSGGHAELLRKRLGLSGLLIGFDQDAEAIAAVATRLGTGVKPGVAQFIAVPERFDTLTNVLDELGIDAIDGIVFDLGVSSHQLDETRRGFSFKDPAMALDMRMDAGDTGARTAADVLAEEPPEELTRIFRDYADERWAARIAEFIARERAAAPIATAGDLTALINRAVPAGARRASGIHPATRVFQALRIAVNDEYSVLEAGLSAAVAALRTGADSRIAVLSYHSGEDRIVKRLFQRHAGQSACVCPPEQPVCICREADNHADLEILTKKPVEASAEETALNPRARSAKLRAARKL